MQDILEKIDKDSLPKHVAIIMDGNGRWAKSRGEERTFGHKNAISAVRNAICPSSSAIVIAGESNDQKLAAIINIPARRAGI